MTRQFRRRSVIGLLCGSTLAAVGSVAAGWRLVLADGAGDRVPGRNGGTGNGPHEDVPGSSPTATPVATPSGREAPPADQVVFIGTVDVVLGTATFVGSSKRFSGVTVDVSRASPIYPKGHLPHAGDDFTSRGRWLGAIGQSIWQAEFVDFNLRRVTGRLETGATSDPEARYTISAGGKTWQIVFRAAETSHFTRGSTIVDLTGAAAFEFAHGTPADIIGYEDRPGVIVATWIEAWV